MRSLGPSELVAAYNLASQHVFAGACHNLQSEAWRLPSSLQTVRTTVPCVLTSDTTQPIHASWLLVKHILKTSIILVMLPSAITQVTRLVWSLQGLHKSILLNRSMSVAPD